MTTQRKAIKDSSAEIMAARLSSRRLDGERISQLVKDPDTAYAVQQMVSERATETALGRPVGYKIGLSTDAAQQLFKVAEPISGHVFESRLLSSPTVLAARPQQKFGVECEIAVRLGDDLPPQSSPYDAECANAAVETFYAAIEILEDRFTALASTPVWALAADDLLGYGGVLGDELVDFDPFVSHEGVLTIDCEQRAQGKTGDLQGGSPMACLAWLANRLATAGAHLKAGQVIFCGGITAPIWIEPRADMSSSSILASITGFGRAELVIGLEIEDEQ